MWGRLSFLARVIALAFPLVTATARDSLNVTRLGQLYNSWDTAEDVVVAGNFAYVAAGNSGLRIVNVTNPAAPFHTGFCDVPGLAHDVVVSGNYA